MEFSKEQIEKAKSCKTIEELKELAKKENATIKDEDLKEIFTLTRTGELSDDDLDKVAGGTKYSSGVDGPSGHQKYVVVTHLNYVGDACAGAGLSPDYKGDDRAYASSCTRCVNMFTVNGVCYCSKRWEGNDPLK